jgi:hypothetical protein
MSDKNTGNHDGHPVPSSKKRTPIPILRGRVEDFATDVMQPARDFAVDLAHQVVDVVERAKAQHGGEALAAALAVCEYLRVHYRERIEGDAFLGHSADVYLDHLRDVATRGD